MKAQNVPISLVFFVSVLTLSVVYTIWNSNIDVSVLLGSKQLQDQDGSEDKSSEENTEDTKVEKEVEEDTLSDDEELDPDNASSIINDLIQSDDHPVNLTAILDLVRKCPDCLTIMRNGCLPIHFALLRHIPDPFLVLMLVKLCPQSLYISTEIETQSESESGHEHEHEHGNQSEKNSLPLHIACNRNDPDIDIVTILLQTDPKLAQTFDQRGFLPFHYAVNRRKPRLDILKLLLEAYPKAVELATQDSAHESALHLHVAHGDSDPNTVKYLMSKYPGITHMKDSKGFTAYELFVVEDEAHLVSSRTPPGLFRSSFRSTPLSSSSSSIDSERDRHVNSHNDSFHLEYRIPRSREDRLSSPSLSNGAKTIHSKEERRHSTPQNRKHSPTSSLSSSSPSLSLSLSLLLSSSNHHDDHHKNDSSNEGANRKSFVEEPHGTIIRFPSPPNYEKILGTHQEKFFPNTLDLKQINELRKTVGHLFDNNNNDDDDDHDHDHSNKKKDI